MTGMLASINIGSINRAMNWGAQYAAKQFAWATVETAFEVMIGKLISAATGIPFDYSASELGRSLATNFVANLATAGLGKMHVLRNLLDFSIRMVSDVLIGRQNLWWAAAVNLGSLAGSALLAHYGKKILGRSIAKWGGCFVPGTPVVVGIDEYFNEADSFTTGTRVKSRLTTTTKAIESIPLGSRVVTEATDHESGSGAFGEPDHSSWARIDFIQHREDGTRIEMELLRPKWWIESLGLQLGTTLPLNFPELQTCGKAQVTAIGECPRIAEGEGEVVIGRFASRDVTNLRCVYLEDGSSFTGTTTHPVWSVEACDWKPIDKLTPGEAVKTLDGTLRIAEVRSGQPSSDVFNIEVNGDHVYRLLSTGVLVHNNTYANLDLAHILLGTIEDGVAGGFHHFPTGHASRTGKIVRYLTNAADNPYGAYKAIVEVADRAGNWFRKSDPSSMFPDHWETSQVLDEIDHAFRNSVPDPAGGGTGFIGLGQSGMEIYMVIRDGIVHSAWPNI